MGGHKIDDLGGSATSSTDKVAFVFAVFVVDHNHYFAGADIGNGVFY
jgi:hypothetical protein